MTLTNTDASQITLKMKQKVLYGWKAANTTLVTSGLSVRKEQPTFQTSTVVLDRRQGGCKCDSDASTNPYQFNGLSQCGCS
jgi:hypothetical protein